MGERKRETETFASYTLGFTRLGPRSQVCCRFLEWKKKQKTKNTYVPKTVGTKKQNKKAVQAKINVFLIGVRAENRCNFHAFHGDIRCFEIVEFDCVHSLHGRFYFFAVGGIRNAAYNDSSLGNKGGGFNMWRTRNGGIGVERALGYSISGALQP